MSRGKREAGLTLIETMIALSLLAIAFLALIQAMIGSSTLSVSSTEDSEATLFAQNKVEEIVSGYTGNSQGISQTLNASFLTNWSSSSTPPSTNATPPYTYLTGSANDLVYSNLYAAATPWAVPATFGNASATAAGWASPVFGSYLGTSTDLQTERLTRLGNGSVTVHFLSEYQYYQATGIVDQLDLVTGHTTAPASAPNPSFQTVSGTKLWTWVNSDYNYYPFTVTVTWVPTSNQVQAGQVKSQTKSVSIMGVAYPSTTRAQ